MKKEIILFFILFSGFVFWQFYISRFQYGESSLIGRAAPHFETQNVRTLAPLKSIDILGKKAVFVNFWATWCDTCRLEIASLNQLFQALDANEVAFVSFLEDAVADPNEAKALLEKYHQKWPVEFPVYLDSQQVAADAYGTFKIPESYVINKKGDVIYRHEGAIVASDLKKIIEMLSKN
jgi:thiol-disulfide isomerase/thioredoxin